MTRPFGTGFSYATSECFFLIAHLLTVIITLGILYWMYTVQDYKAAFIIILLKVYTGMYTTFNGCSLLPVLYYWVM